MLIDIKVRRVGNGDGEAVLVQKTHVREFILHGAAGEWWLRWQDAGFPPHDQFIPFPVRDDDPLPAAKKPATKKPRRRQPAA
jgi:hypothetical protein